MQFRPWFLKLGPRCRRLMRDGMKAEAVVLESESWGWVSGALQPNTKLRLRVHFDDGTTAEVERIARYTVTLGRHTAGSTLPMRYEEKDRSYVEIDAAELRRRETAREAKIHRELVASAERRIARGRSTAVTRLGLPATSGAGDAVTAASAKLNDDVIRLKVDHQANRIGDDDYAVRHSVLAAQVRELPDTDDPDEHRLAVLGRIVLGEPSGVDEAEESEVRLGASFLERTVRLKVRHERGEITDETFGQEAATIAAEIAAYEDDA
ncbi:hypothetical protein ACQP00_28475 [Dactylosporangium sp. CS-047395]|uniref:hypothetical protein n=1 Tax=Dactylosporangium sp. CS-047395 TaxID=3239936 RepID=UPI003D8CD3B6